MDLFNKKKVERLEEEIVCLKRDKERLTNEINTLKDILKNQNCSSLVLEENKRLIDWIEKILSAFGTFDVYERQSIKIPIYSHRAYSCSPNGEIHNQCRREVTIIPELVIEKEIQL